MWSSLSALSPDVSGNLLKQEYFAAMSTKHSSPFDSGAHWKVRSDVSTLHIDLLSARCTVDRLRRSIGPTMVAAHADPQKLNDIHGNLLVIASFLQSVQAQLDQANAGEIGEA